MRAVRFKVSGGGHYVQHSRNSNNRHMTNQQGLWRAASTLSNGKTKQMCLLGNSKLLLESALWSFFCAAVLEASTVALFISLALISRGVARHVTLIVKTDVLLNIVLTIIRRIISLIYALLELGSLSPEHLLR